MKKKRKKNCSWGSICPSFPQYFQYFSNLRGQITYSFVKYCCSIYFFLNSANLICRGTDISKYFRESLGPPDNESRLYISYIKKKKKKTLRKHAYSNILKSLPSKNKNVQIKISDIFHISAQNIDYGYPLEPPRRGVSNEYTYHNLFFEQK